jgi:hypothetical protein
MSWEDAERGTNAKLLELPVVNGGSKP